MDRLGTSRHMPYVIYTTIREFFRHRGINTTHTWMESTAFTSNLNTYEHVKIEGNKGDQYVMCWLLMPGSKYGLRAPEYKKLLNMVPNSKTPGSNFIVIGDSEPSPHVRKAAEEFRSEHPTCVLEHHTYDLLNIVIPRHVGVPLHTIATTDQIAEWCKEHGTVKEDLSRILVTDPPVVWCGARQGEVVKIYRSSESAGKAVAMRLVI